MKIIPLLIATSFALSTAHADQAPLNKEQVVEMARIVAKRYLTEQVFVIDKPTYDEKTGLWSLSPGSASTAGTHFLEIRDKDLYFRVGFMGNTGFSPNGSDKFRLPPDLKNKFEKITGKEAK